jgi:transposase-like protein
MAREAKQGSGPRVAADGRKSRAGMKPEAVREQAILALLTEKTIAAAAERAGVGERTLRRWMAEDEAFKADLGAARRAAFQAGMARVQALSATAIDTLEQLLAPAVSDHVRLGAAKAIADLGIHFQDTETILQKLDEIEAAQRQQQ